MEMGLVHGVLLKVDLGKMLESNQDLSPCKKSPKYRIFSGPSFPVFGLNTEF